MRKEKWIVGVIASVSAAVCGANGVMDSSPLDFQAHVGSECDAVSNTLEAGPLAVAIGQVAIKAVVGLAGTLLTEAGQDKTLSLHAQSSGSLYQADEKKWAPSGENCIRFWYGRLGDGATGVYPELGGTISLQPLALRWKALGLTETPYLYGEVRVLFSEDLKSVRFVPVRYFSRPAPEFSSIFRPNPRLSVAIDLREPGKNEAFATYVLGFPSAVNGSVMANQRSLWGKRSGWFTRPDPPQEPPIESDHTGVGNYSAILVATAVLPGSKLAASLGSALIEDKGAVIDALKPISTSDKQTANVAATKAAFDAIADVASARAALETADVSKKPELEIKLRKAMYMADVALVTAGLAPKYGVNSP